MDYYQHSSSLSTIFKRAGFSNEWLREIGDSHKLDGLLIDFCPLFRQWVHQFAGEKAMELVIEHYGLFGDERLPLEILASNLDLDNAMSYKIWALRKLSEPYAQEALGHIAQRAGAIVLSEKANQFVDKSLSHGAEEHI